MKGCRIAVTSSEEVFAEFLRNLGSESLKSFYNIYWTRLLNSCNIQRIIGSKISAKSNYERGCRIFCDIQCITSCRISVIYSVWVVTEFLRHPVCENLHNFCNIQWISGYRTSATSSALEHAKFLQNLVNERL